MELFYRKLGKGQPLIILHGLFGMSDNWMSIARRLAERYTVFLLDQRNHGHSPHSDEFNYDVLLDDLHRFIVGQNLSQVRLIGHSMGGKVAMRYALNFSSRVEKPVVVDIAPKTYTHPHFKLFFEALFAIHPERLTSRKEADDILAQKIPQPAIRQFLLKNLVRGKDGRFRWRIHLKAIYLNLPKIMEGLRDIRVFDKPALFLRGGRSDYILDGDFSLIYKWFPMARIETIPQATHWLHADAPEEFCSHLEKFYDDKRPYPEKS
ncbi:MAG TPA: alpha/beta fold hydrolase [Caldithrix abyssi]|uniref:Alpha/beta fold hydrolase n=1 Tax=Caldithrix abyssi TaxID=187145 RepID=A0A7V4U3N8_CALAY|nr:alpha/beta fold hydrolase [Caldithrix abyssi]